MVSIWKRAVGGGLVVGFVGLAISSQACSLLLGDDSAGQCSSDTECWSNANFSGTDALGRHQFTCQRGICAPATGFVEGPEAGGGACQSTAQCFKDNGSVEPWVCQRPGVDPCVKLLSEDCKAIERKTSGGTVAFSTTGYAGFLDENPLIVGSVAPFTYVSADTPDQKTPIPLIEHEIPAIDVAVNEWNLGVQGIQGAKDARPRRVFVLHCNSNLDPTGTTQKRIAKHLLEVAKVKAMLVASDQDLGAMAPDLVKANIPTVCYECENAVPSSLQSKRSTYRVRANGTTQVPLLKAWVTQLEAKIAPAADNNAVVLYVDDPGLNAFATEVVAQVKFNGKAPTPIKLQNATISTDLLADVIRDQILPLKPSVIIPLSTADYTATLVKEIERLWTTGPRPHYVTESTASNQDFVSGLFGSVSDPDGLVARVTGTKLRPNAANYAAYKIAYPKATDDAWLGYEGFYALAYALTAEATGPGFNGTFTGAGFARLTSASEVNLRTGDIQSGVADLTAGRPIDLRGITTPLDWDLATGNVKDGDWQVSCVKKDAQGKFVLVESSGLVWEGKSSSVTGTFACP